MLAARLVIEGLVPEGTMRAVLAKQRELAERGRPLGVGEICARKQWVTASEVRWLGNPDQPPGDLLPGLRLGPLIGQGGMSRVYMAQGDQGPLAVKILHPRLRRSGGDLEEFRREAHLLVSLRHENIVCGRALREHDGLVYLEMELVEGKSIQQLLDDGFTFPEDAALYIVLQVARALSHLHRRGLVHRDIKPANILIDRENRVKLCDLGLAVVEGAGAGEVTAGTAQYISPEQALADSGVDVRSDIYSLGVSLYQLVVGKLPFDGGSSQETISKRLLDELRSRDLKAKGVSPHVHYFIQKMMALDPAIRYQDPEELIEDVESQVQGRTSLTAGPKGAGASDPFRDGPFQKPVVVVRRQPPGGLPSRRRR